jgi:hypothetical protein
MDAGREEKMLLCECTWWWCAVRHTCPGEPQQITHRAEPLFASPPGAANARGEILGDYFIIILLLIEFRGGDSQSEKSASEGNALLQFLVETRAKGEIN